MVIPNSGRYAKYALFRLTTLAFGAVLFGWGWICFGVAQSSSPFEAISRQIVAGEQFGYSVVLAAASKQVQLPYNSSSAAIFRAQNIIHLRLLEKAIERADRFNLSKATDALSSILLASMKTNPADGLAWFSLFWLENFRGGEPQKRLAMLARSYQLSPRELWIAEVRNRLSLASFPLLDAKSQNLVSAEFAGLVENGVLPDAVRSFLGPGWAIREILLADIIEVSPARKLAFSRMVSQEGQKIEIKGLPAEADRPWR